MGRIYQTRIVENGDSRQYIVSVKCDSANETEAVVNETLYEEIVALQRAIWRLERRDSRHCVHIERTPDCYLPHARETKTPEEIVIESCESDLLNSALAEIPDKQRRRFILRHEHRMSLKEIARLEGCSERAVKYSIALAKKNLKDILEGDFL